MQIGQDLKIAKRSPRVTLWDRVLGYLAVLGVSAANQVELNGVAISTVKTVKKTIGAPGVAGCDFNFASAANTTAQAIDLGGVIPPLARVMDIKTHTEVAFATVNTLAAVTGNAASGNQFIASATIRLKNAITAMANAGALAVAPVSKRTHVFVTATPGQNWSGINAGKLAVYITYQEPCAVIPTTTTTTTTTAAPTTTTAAPTTTTAAPTTTAAATTTAG